MIPNIGTELGADMRNIINKLIDVVNGQSAALQDLVAKGQLTEEEYQNLLIALNSLIKKGEVTVNDLNVKEGKITEKYIADELINRIKASEMLSKENQEKFINYIKKGEVTVSDININLGKIGLQHLSDEVIKAIAGTASVNAVPADNSITTLKMANKAVTRDKLSDGYDAMIAVKSGADTYSITATGGYLLTSGGGYLNMPKNYDNNTNYHLYVESSSGAWALQRLYRMDKPEDAWCRIIHKTSSTIKYNWYRPFVLDDKAITGNHIVDNVGFKQNLDNNTDLNNVYIEGGYLGLATNTYTNLPTDLKGKNFALHVLPARADGAFNVQIITPFDDQTVTYKRFRFGKTADAKWQAYRTSEAINSTKPLNGKNIVTFGDSITELGNYPELLAALTGMNVTKAGFGGCTMAEFPKAGIGQYYNAMSMQKLSEYIKSGDWSELLSAAEYLKTNASDNNTVQANALANLDWSKVNYASIFFGTNDYSLSLPIGTDGDIEGTTFKGALNKIIKNISESQPHVKLVFITPMYRDRFKTPGDGNNSDQYTNEAGVKLQDYVDAIKTIAIKHHIPVIDLMNDSGINKYNQSYYLSDGLHPNTTGYTYLADTLARQMTARL